MPSATNVSAASTMPAPSHQMAGLAEIQREKAVGRLNSVCSTNSPPKEWPMIACLAGSTATRRAISGFSSSSMKARKSSAPPVRTSGPSGVCGG